MLILEWESAGRGGGWGVSAVRLFAYQCRADTAPMVLRDRWGMSKCVFLCTYVSVGCECHWTPGQVLKDGFAFESRCTLPSLPFPSLPPLLPCSVTPQGVIWWEWFERLRALQGMLLSPVHLFQTVPCGTVRLSWGPWWLGIRPSKRHVFQVDCFGACWMVAMTNPI